MRSLISLLIVCFCLTAHAARRKTQRRINSTSMQVTRSADAIRRVPSPKTIWDSKKTYRVPVVLVSFADCDFSEEHDPTFYQRLFNEKGFNLGAGPGCVTDYFRDQSQGQFNLKFDIVGPMKLSTNQKTKGSNNFGDRQFNEALKMTRGQLDFADYDWDGDGEVEVVIIIYAGFGGNEEADIAEDCIWPNTDRLYMSIDNMKLGYYSSSPEIWTDNESCGIGTICHEFCHVLGLPDFYPTSGSEFSTLDEWDLMDGGNYIDNGWCPPNLSIHEREYLGWQQPEELTVARTITGMPSFNSSGKGYRIVNDAYPTEYYLLENRQWEGWDYMLPNHGLLITHVDFEEDVWRGNKVNRIASHHRLEHFHADNHDFNYYERIYGDGDDTRGEDGRNLRLQYTSYPYVNEKSFCNDALTDTSEPAAMIFHPRADEVSLMDKSVMDIREEDGLVSFRFIDTSTGIVSLSEADARPVAYYDLRGCLLSEPPVNGIYIIRYNDGSTRKAIR